RSLIKDDVAQGGRILGGRQVADIVRLQAGVPGLDVDGLLQDELVFSDDRAWTPGDLQHLAARPLADELLLAQGPPLGGGGGRLMGRRGRSAEDGQDEAGQESGGERHAQVTATPAYPTTERKSPVVSPECP